MLTRLGGQSDLVKVLDFGLVRRVAEKGDVTLTMEGSIAGTPEHMSPEAAQGMKELDASSDIYSLGCIAYYLASGRPPFKGRNPIEICWKQVQQEPVNLASLTPQPVSDEFCQIVSRCLVKNPADRPQEISDLLAMLEQCETLQAWGRLDADQWWAEFQYHSETIEVELPSDTTAEADDPTR